MQDRVDVPDGATRLMLTLVGAREQLRLVEGDTVAVRLTVPVNPFVPVIVIVDWPVEPASTVTFPGLAATLKSWRAPLTGATETMKARKDNPTIRA